MKLAILGFGIEGRSAYAYFSKDPDAEITICDSNESLTVPEGANARLGTHYLDRLDDFDLIVRSPGVLPTMFETGAQVTSALDEFLAHCPAPVIGVTGSKGKGTTATLAHEMLEAAGKTAWLGGNIGTPPLDFLDQVKPDHVVVLEMSNLQLWDITRSPQVAVLLMITPEHLDWHEGSMEAYVATKANITTHQSSSDRLFYRADNTYTEQIAKGSPAQTVPFMTPESAWVDGEVIRYEAQEVCMVSDVNLPGTHNLDNVCAAVAAVWQFAPDPRALKAAIRPFKGLPHRLEYVAEKSGVDYYDDSIGTTPEATMAALAAFKQPKVLIMGGSSKGADFAELARAIKDTNVRGIFLMGDTASELKAALEAAKYEGAVKLIDGEAPMQQAVRGAAELAEAGDVVLLAPACASFGLFKNYQDRGDQFKASVATLS